MIPFLSLGQVVGDFQFRLFFSLVMILLTILLFRRYTF